MTIKTIFDEIANESSSNKKMDILRSYKDNKLLKDVLYQANSKRIKFYIKQIPSYSYKTSTLSLDEALFGLSEISNRLITGNAAIYQLVEILSNTSPDDAYIVERIIEKDCKIGMGTSNINKVFPDLIEKTPYMGAKAFDTKLVKALFKGGAKAFSQIKMDGRYANGIIRGGDVELESRQGEPTILDGAQFIEELKAFSDCVLNGELTMGGGISRYESNGIIASLVSIGGKKLAGEDVTKEIAKFEAKHLPYQEALNLVRYTVWDKISVEDYFNKKSLVEYEKRLEDAFKTVMEAKCKMISIIEGEPIYSFEEAMACFKKALNAKEEGTVVKSAKGIWKDGKPNWCVKLKKEINLDLKIVGFNYGTGKNANVISSIDVESSDGLLKTSPTGMAEDIMAFITENQDRLLNTILEIKCCGLSQDNEGNYSVLHPVYIGLRTDKTVANSLKECIEIDNAAMELAA